MTHNEFHKLPCRCVSHLSFDTGHMSAYIMKTPKGEVRIETNVRKLKNGEFGKSSRTYIFRDKEYKSVDELLKDYNGFEQSNGSSEGATENR